MNSGVCGMHFGPSIMTEIWADTGGPDFVIIILLHLVLRRHLNAVALRV